MNKKKTRTMIVLIVLLAALAGAYAGITAYNKKEKPKENPETSTGSAVTQLLSMERDLVDRISVETAEEYMSFVKKDDVWVVETEEDFDLKQSSLNNMVSVLTNLKAGRTIEETRTNLEEYGLDEPVITVTATAAGKYSVLYIGIKNTVTGDYYAYTSESEGVYTISASDAAYFETSLYELAALEAMPDIAEGSYFSLEVDWGENHYRTEYMEDSVYDASNMMTWFVTEPYEHEYVAQTTVLDTIFEGITGLSYEKLAAYKPDEALLKDMGFETPQGRLAYTYSDEVNNMDDDAEAVDPADLKKFVLLVGNLDESGSYYYVKEESSDQVYLIAASSLDEIMKYNAKDIVNKYFALINIETVDRVTFTIEGGSSYELITPKAVDEGEAVDAMRSLYQDIIGIHAEKLTDPIDEPYKFLPISVVFHRNTEPYEYTVQFAEYDTSFCLAIVNGEAIYLVNKRDYEQYNIDIPKGFDSLSE